MNGNLKNNMELLERIMHQLNLYIESHKFAKTYYASKKKESKSYYWKAEVLEDFKNYVESLKKEFMDAADDE